MNHVLRKQYLILVIKNHIFILVLLSETCHCLFEMTTILVIPFYFESFHVMED